MRQLAFKPGDVVRWHWAHQRAVSDQVCLRPGTKDLGTDNQTVTGDAVLLPKESTFLVLRVAPPPTEGRGLKLVLVLSSAGLLWQAAHYFARVGDE